MRSSSSAVRTASAGYTLMEVALVTGVLGIMLASFLSAYNIYLQAQARQKTELNVSLVTSAFSNFLIQNGRYPCPARMNATRSDADYGLETDCDMANAATTYPTAITPGAPVAGTCVNGLCFEQIPAHLVDHDGNAATATISPIVRRGAVPFRTLGLPEDRAEDGFNTRLQYAVTEILSVTATHRRENGGIRVVNDAGSSFFQVNGVDGYTHYFLFSPGPDRAGGTSRWGNTLDPCPTGTLDSENCDTLTDSSATYRTAAYSSAAGARHYDDYVKFFTATETPLWRVSGTGAHIRDLIGVEMDPVNRKVSVGGSPDLTNDALLQVAGDVRAKGGGPIAANSYSTQLCAHDNTKCFQGQKLGEGDAGDFRCPKQLTALGPADPVTHIYASGFSNGRIECTDQPSSGCPAGSFVKDIDAAGKINCVADTSCVPKTISMCYGATYDLGTGNQGDIKTTPVSGASWTQNWRCGPSDQWTLVTTSGYCGCAPLDETYDVPCNSVRSGNWTGYVTMRHTITCGPTVDTTVEVSDTCSCADYTEGYTDFAGCGPGFTGAIAYERTWSCSTATAGAWSSWVIPPGGDTCVCQPSTENQTLSCPVAYTGVWEQQREHQCPANVWTPWADTTNTCACDSSYKETRAVGCVTGWSGYKVEERTYDCGTDTFNAWTETEDNCSCTPATETQTLSCGTGYSGAITQERTFSCPAATWSSWATTANTCACTGATETRTVSCTAPLVGTKEEQRTFGCSPPGWGGWTATGVENCAAVTYSWVPKTSANGPNPSALPKHAGDSCAIPGSTSSCSAEAGGGLGHWYYDTCQCQ